MEDGRHAGPCRASVPGPHHRLAGTRARGSRCGGGACKGASVVLRRRSASDAEDANEGIERQRPAPKGTGNGAYPRRHPRHSASRLNGPAPTITPTVTVREPAPRRPSRAERAGYSSRVKLDDLRREYAGAPLTEAAAGDDPLALFERWFQEAVAAQVPFADGMVLATSAPDGQPSARTVLLKRFDARGFAFYTSYQSRKAEELEANPSAALLFWWPELHRQVRVEGRVARLERGRVGRLLRHPAAREQPVGHGVAAEPRDRQPRRARARGRAPHRRVGGQGAGATGDMGRLLPGPASHRVLAGTAGSASRPPPLSRRPPGLDTRAALSLNETRFTLARASSRRPGGSAPEVCT